MEENCDERRARLQAWRMEAESASFPAPPPPQLSNPLLRPPEPETSPSPSSRFGYYTDPMAAFSFSKRKRPFQPSDGGFSSSPGSRPPFPPPSVGQRGYQMTPLHAPAPQFHQNLSSHHGSPVLGPFVGGQWRSPVQQGSPHIATPFANSHHAAGFSAPFASSHHTAGFSAPSYFSGGRSGRGGSPISTMARSGLHSNSGRGQRPCGRGWSSGDSVRGGGSARQEGKQLYTKSMVEDPWRELKPVVGNILVPRADSNSWRSKYLAEKKGKQTECGNSFKSQSSLAEFLAAALEDAVNDEPEAPT